MRIFKKWVVMKVKTQDAIISSHKQAVLRLDKINRELVADRDAADRQVARLLHHATEVTLLWAAVRQAKAYEQVRQIYQRMRPCPKSKVKVPLKHAKLGPKASW